MRVVITGGCGFIGGALALHLLENIDTSHEIILVDTMQRHGKRGDLEDHLSSQFKIIQADLTNPASLAELPTPVDRLYHLAAIVGVDIVEVDPIRVMRDNTLSLLHILNWFIQNSSPESRFLFSSSSEIYSGADIAGCTLPIPTPEDVPGIIADLGNPRFSYALTKMWGEAYCKYLAQKKQIFTISVRYHNIYGPRMGNSHVIPQILSRIFAQEIPFKIVAAEQTRSFCWIGDAIQATYLVMEAKRIESGTVVHIGNEKGEIAIGKLYELLFDLCQWWPTYRETFPAPEGSVRRRCPDTKRLQRLTGYTPTTSLTEGLKQTIAWYQKHPYK